MAAPDPHDGSKRRSSFAEEWRVLRAVARADGSVGRILDGHFNGVERVSVWAPEPLRSRELAAVASGRLRLGVWGSDRIPGEGTPARLVATGGGYSLQGVKTFCSGATGLDRALVAVSTKEVSRRIGCTFRPILDRWLIGGWDSIWALSSSRNFGRFSLCSHTPNSLEESL